MKKDSKLIQPPKHPIYNVFNKTHIGIVCNSVKDRLEKLISKSSEDTFIFAETAGGVYCAYLVDTKYTESDGINKIEQYKKDLIQYRIDYNKYCIETAKRSNAVLKKQLRELNNK
jgi:hypothetical protein